MEKKLTGNERMWSSGSWELGFEEEDEGFLVLLPSSSSSSRREKLRRSSSIIKHGASRPSISRERESKEINIERERKKKAAKGFVLCIFGEREVMGTLFSFQLGILSTKQNPLDGWQPGDGDFWPVFISLLFYLFFYFIYYFFYVYKGNDILPHLSMLFSCTHLNYHSTNYHLLIFFLITFIFAEFLIKFPLSILSL